MHRQLQNYDPDDLELSVAPERGPLPIRLRDHHTCVEIDLSEEAARILMGLLGDALRQLQAPPEAEHDAVVVSFADARLQKPFD